LFTFLNRPDSKRKLLIAAIFIFAFALSIAEIDKDIESFTTWGSMLALLLMAVTAWPMIKESIWPSGLDHVAGTQLSLACHGWKNAYFGLDRGIMDRLETVEGENIWQKIINATDPECTDENINKYQTLFVNEAINTQRRIDEVLGRYGDVLPHELRVLAQSALTQLSLSPFSYAMFAQSPSKQSFVNQFKQILFVLEKLERPAHELQTKTKVK